jgi:hypothetical protein
MALPRTDSGSATTSWVIRNRATREFMFETWQPALVAKLDMANYEAVPILDYLAGLAASAAAHAATTGGASAPPQRRNGR